MIILILSPRFSIWIWGPDWESLAYLFDLKNKNYCVCFSHHQPELSSLALYFPWPLFRQWQPFDSVIYWIFLHNMFRPSGPDHVLARTAKIQGKPHRKWMWGLSQIKTNYMAEKVKVKALYTRKLRHCFKKVALQGRDCPSPLRARAPPC